MLNDQKATNPNAHGYHLDEQVGFILRRVTQRHLSIFGSEISELTPMQFAALAKLKEAGDLSQIALGRLTGMDAATIKGVVDRLAKRNLLQTEGDKQDRRRTVVALTDEGRVLFDSLVGNAFKISEETLAALSETEQAMFLHLLRKLV